MDFSRDNTGKGRIFKVSVANATDIAAVSIPWKAEKPETRKVSNGYIQEHNNIIISNKVQVGEENCLKILALTS